MIVRQFADNTTLNRLANSVPDNEDKGIVWPNLMVNTTASDYEKKVSETSLTIISNIHGHADCRVGGQAFTVCTSVFLIANPFQQLEYSIGANEHVETTNIHFNYLFVQNLYRYFTATDASLLDNIENTECTMPFFFNELHYKGKEMSTLIQQLSHSKEEYQFEEKLSEIGVQLFLTQRDCQKKLKSIKARKANTRKELYKRVSRAKDIIYYSHDQPISIEEISKDVCLSKYHFTRLFKDVYGISPYQFLKAVRLEKAKELLTKHYSVEEIAHQVGFMETNSFSNAFKSYAEVYPTEFRRLFSKIE